MSIQTKAQNLEKIRIRLATSSLPSKLKGLPASVINVLAESSDLDPVIKIIIEQNNTIKSANGRRLVAENTVASLQVKLKYFLNPQKSEIVQLWNQFFGKATKDDDRVLSQIGASSNETAREDLNRAEQVVQQAIEIAQKYKDKYGKL